MGEEVGKWQKKYTTIVAITVANIFVNMNGIIYENRLINGRYPSGRIWGPLM